MAGNRRDSVVYLVAALVAVIVALLTFGANHAAHPDGTTASGGQGSARHA